MAQYARWFVDSWVSTLRREEWHKYGGTLPNGASITQEMRAGMRSNISRDLYIARTGRREAAPCLDKRPKSQTRFYDGPELRSPAGVSPARRVVSRPVDTRMGASSLVQHRVRLFASGEVECSTVPTVDGARARRAPAPRPGAAPRDGEPSSGRAARVTSGVSSRGRRSLRRAISGRVLARKAVVCMYTLTSRAVISDEEFKHRVSTFLSWGRKYLGPWFREYVLVYELQQRGVLHAHLILFSRVPYGLWRRMRDHWAVTYAMGPGSFDVKVKMRDPGRTWAYLCKYLTKMFDEAANVRVGRNGLPYERSYFSGNAYSMSKAMRYFTKARTEYLLPWRSPSAWGLLKAIGDVGGYRLSFYGALCFAPSLAMARGFVDEELRRHPLDNAYS